MIFNFISYRIYIKNNYLFNNIAIKQIVLLNILKMSNNQY